MTGPKNANNRTAKLVSGKDAIINKGTCGRRARQFLSLGRSRMVAAGDRWWLQPSHCRTLPYLRGYERLTVMQGGASRYGTRTSVLLSRRSRV